MNVYQLVPMSCYDDDDGGHSAFWSRGTLDVDENGQPCHSDGFYVDAVGDSGGEDVGWYSIVVHDSCTASVPPVPRLLPLDGRHLRFFDDDDSSAENETFFGRTLDTISEEDEDEMTASDTETDTEQQDSSTDEDRRFADRSKSVQINGAMMKFYVIHIFYVSALL